MKAKIDGTWQDVPTKKVGTMKKSEELQSKFSTLFSRYSGLIESAKSAVAAASKSLAPLTGTDPELQHFFSQSNTGYAPQGGCTDGTYLYFYIKQGTETNPGTLVKLLLSDFSVIATTSANLYHGNDMTYNPDTGLIYVSTMYEEGTHSRIDIVDPKSLSVIDSQFVPIYISAIAYEPSRHVFVGRSGRSKQFYLIRIDSTGALRWYKTIPTLEMPQLDKGDASSQGITCDSAFIYHSWSYASRIYIEIFNWLGEYMGEIQKIVRYNNGSTEVEFIDKLGKHDFIGGFYASGVHDAAAIYTFSAT